MNEPAAITLAAIKDEIRAEAEALRLATSDASLPKSHARPVRRADDERHRLVYSIAELCAFPYTTFVDQAFRNVLKRPPDPAGFDAHVRLVVSGASKIEVLGNLRYSPEGRAIGVRIRGLLPQYILTKLFRVPVLGYALEWLLVLARLPKIIREQRALDMSHFARSFEIDAAGRKLKHEVGLLRDASERFAERTGATQAGLQAQLVAHQQAVRVELDAFSGAASASHLVLSMNHWLSELRRNLGALEAEELEQRGWADAPPRAGFEQRSANDAARRARVETWADQLAARLPPHPRVLDLGSGRDWIERLGERGVDATGADRARASAASATGAAASVIPVAALASTGDHGLDALTALSSACVMRTVGVATFVTIAQRVLKPGAWLLLGFEPDPGMPTDRPAAAGDPAIQADWLAAALAAAGFIDIVHAHAADASVSVLARNPPSSIEPA